jgi:hypothetical protein
MAFAETVALLVASRGRGVSAGPQQVLYLRCVTAIPDGARRPPIIDTVAIDNAGVDDL